MTDDHELGVISEKLRDLGVETLGAGVPPNGRVLWIVSRRHREIYDLLVRHLSASPNDSIVFDRRLRNRRQQPITVSGERRSGQDRRRRLDPAFAGRGWTAVRLGRASGGR